MDEGLAVRLRAVSPSPLCKMRIMKIGNCRFDEAGLRQRLRSSAGVSIIEVLIGILIVVIASIGTLTYFGYGMGNIRKQGNRRAALERARERLEQLMADNISQLPAQDGNCYYCAVATCITTSWIAYACGTTPPAAETNILVENQANMRRETTAQFIDDQYAGTDTLDVYEFSTKVWFTKNTGADDDLNRVYIRTLRTP